MTIDFPGGSDGKESTSMWETWVWSLGWEDPLEEGMATHSSILAWRVPMDRGPWRASEQLSTAHRLKGWKLRWNSIHAHEVIIFHNISLLRHHNNIIRFNDSLSYINQVYHLTVQIKILKFNNLDISPKITQQGEDRITGRQLIAWGTHCCCCC